MQFVSMTRIHTSIGFEMLHDLLITVLRVRTTVVANDKSAACSELQYYLIINILSVLVR
jgi:hypothetical protein